MVMVIICMVRLLLKLFNSKFYNLNEFCNASLVFNDF